MKKCRLRDTRIQHEDNEDEITWKNSANCPLKSLSIEHIKPYYEFYDPLTDLEILKVFEGCSQLQSFKTDISRIWDPQTDQDRLHQFLGQQTNLKKLSLHSGGFDLGLMSVFKLEELTPHIVTLGSVRILQ